MGRSPTVGPFQKKFSCIGYVEKKKTIVCFRLKTTPIVFKQKKIIYWNISLKFSHQNRKNYKFITQAIYSLKLLF